jgi:hypothetical protein
LRPQESLKERPISVQRPLPRPPLYQGRIRSLHLEFPSSRYQKRPHLSYYSTQITHFDGFRNKKPKT